MTIQSSPSLFKRIMRFIGKSIKWFFILSIVSVVVFKWLPVPITPLMIWSLPKQMLNSERKIRLKKDWESIDNISPHLQLAVVCSEDQNFLKHNGFDLVAIKKALRNNERGRKIKGGSTISQQTAKNVFLLPTRSYIRKAFEVYFTFLIELIWSKERILEVYLNVIEFGDGIYGAEAASLHFFNKSAKNLSKEQAALLASVLPNPIKYKADNPSSFINRRKRWVVRQMNMWGNHLPME
jgi:monofunctional glycosyltransferase